jgi:hypothetical protein
MSPDRAPSCGSRRWKFERSPGPPVFRGSSRNAPGRKGGSIRDMNLDQFLMSFDSSTQAGPVKPRADGPSARCAADPGSSGRIETGGLPLTVSPHPSAKVRPCRRLWWESVCPPAARPRADSADSIGVPAWRSRTTTKVGRRPRYRLPRSGLDIAGPVFQAHGVDARGRVVPRKQLTRAPRCGGAHYCARELTGLGHELRPMPPQSRVPDRAPRSKR